MHIPVITTSRRITTARLTTRVLFSGPEDGIPVLFVHGNLSAATWWEETMLRLPPAYRAIAPDLRGYGEADPAALIDATRGLSDLSDDLAALLTTLKLDAVHLVGHSLGGGVLWTFLTDYPGHVLSLTQVAPSTPFGFGGVRPDGKACFADGAGSGAGAVNPEFARLLAAGERGADTPFHPRSILNTYVWKPPFVPARIEEILTSALAQQTGPKAYPGDALASANWPTVAPGRFGPINAMAPIYQSDPLGFVRAGTLPPILWLRGADDPVVSDTSLFDLGTLGSLGAVPGWPGLDVFPPQPMIRQTASALDAYAAAGGRVTRVVLEDCGHSPYLEQPDAFDAALHAHLAAT
jgi:pimeloyl-ACP methyl ester carboxylesterase